MILPLHVLAIECTFFRNSGSLYIRDRPSTVCFGEGGGQRIEQLYKQQVLASNQMNLHDSPSVLQHALSPFPSPFYQTPPQQNHSSMLQF